MPIAVLVLALVAYAAALLAYPEFRRWGIVGGVVAAAGLAFYFTQAAPPEATRAGMRIAPAELVLDQLDLERIAGGATLTGRVRNDSPDYRLRELTLALRLRDCPDATGPVEACPVIGEATAIARPDAPPGQIRALSAHFLFRNLPPVTGVLRWDWEILGTRATEGERR